MPPIVAITGEAYAGPSPVHRQRGAPVAASNAVSAPLFSPPMCAITSAPSTIGDMAVPNSGGAAGGGVRHSSLPVARSSAERMPLMPNVNTRPLAMAGVDFGPGPCARAAEFIVYGAA